MPSKKKVNSPQSDLASGSEIGGRSDSMVGEPPEDFERILVRKVGEVLETIVVCLELYGFDRKGFSLDRSLAHWLNLCYASVPLVSPPLIQDSWIAVTKWKLAAFFSHYRREENPLNVLPKCPFPEGLDNPAVLLGGRAYRWCRLKLRNVSIVTDIEAYMARESLLFSIQMVKKGCPRPGEAFCSRAVEESFDLLTTQQPIVTPPPLFPLWGDSEERKLDPTISDQRLFEELDKTVDELFSDAKKWDLADIEPFVPSTSAQYNYSRAGGGAVGALKTDPALLKYYNAGKLVSIKARPFVPEWRKPDVSELFPNYSGTFDPVYTEPPLYSNPFYRNRDEYIMVDHEWVVDDTDLYHHFLRFYTDLSGQARFEEPLVEQIGLSEANKARVISKGPPKTYTVLKPLQKRMWAQLRRHECFSLIGEPITPLYVLKRMGAKLKDDELYLSGDYKSATDLLRPEVSNRIAERISFHLGLPDFLKELFIRSLTGHLIGRFEYDRMHKVLLETRPQAWGQLMGSITSFPVLCIANAALCRWANELAYDRRWSLSDCRLAINGDDVIMRTNKLGVTAWRRITAFAGLQESVGKTYFSRRYLNMNSMAFIYSPEHPVPFSEEVLERTQNVPEPLPRGIPQSDRYIPVMKLRENPFRETKFVNFGLMFGMKRSSTMDRGALTIDDVLDDDEEQSIGARHRELMHCCPTELRLRVHKTFLNRHWKILSSVRVPWYVPEWAGGVGLSPVVDLEGEIDSPRSYLHGYGPSEMDLQVLRKILFNHQKEFPKRLPAMPEWNFHQFALDRLPARPLVSPDPPKQFVGELERCTNALTVEAFFRYPLVVGKEDIVVQDALKGIVDWSVETEEGFGIVMSPKRAQEIFKKKFKMILRHNERLWRKNAEGKLPAPLSISLLTDRKYQDWLPVVFAR